MRRSRIAGSRVAQSGDTERLLDSVPGFLRGSASLGMMRSADPYTGRALFLLGGRSGRFAALLFFLALLDDFRLSGRRSSRLQRQAPLLPPSAKPRAK